MDSLFNEFLSLIISTLFYLLYLHFNRFAKKNKEANNTNSDPDENELISSPEINPNIDEMLSSLNSQIQSIDNNSNSTLSPNHLQNTQNVSKNQQHPHNEQECIHSMQSLLNSSSSQILSPRCKIKAIPVISAAFNELTSINNNNNNNKLRPNNMYYDTLEFDDENEYDSDTLNEYDSMNHDNSSSIHINHSLHRITSNRSKSTLFAMSTDETMHNKHKSHLIKDIIHETSNGESQRQQIQNESISSLNNMNNHHQFGGESGSDDVDRYIQENEFLLNEDNEFSSGHSINHEINDKKDVFYVENEFEADLKNFDVDLSSFPKEEDIYPSRSS